MSDIFQRKRDHIDLCNTGDVGPGDHRGLFEELWLVHDAMPELSMADLDTTTRFLDHDLKAPVMVTGMTGGPPEAAAINRGIARVCARMGLAFGVGSQRIITKAETTAETFSVRDVAPDLVLFGSLLLWSVLDFRSSRQRDRAAGTVYPAGTLSGTVATVAVGAVVWAVFAFWAHGWLFGVRPFG